MLSEELQIYQTAYKLIKMLYTYERNMPKSVRYGEHQRAIALMFDALDVIYLANRDADKRRERLERYLEPTGAVIKRDRVYALNRNVGNIYEVIETWNKTVSPTTEQTRRFCKRINSAMGMLGHRNEYGLRWKIWRMIEH